MSNREVMQQALEALENAVRYHGIMLMSDPPQDAWKYHRVEDNAKQAITALREALAQPEQEPVISAWSLREVYFDEDGEPSMHRSPPAAPSPAAQRPWVGLDEDDIRKLYGKDLNYRDGNYVRYAMAVEAKLKERNT